MKRIPLPAVVIIALAAVALAFIVWSAAAEPDTTPSSVPTLTAPAPDTSPYPGPDPYPPPDDEPVGYPAPRAYLPVQVSEEGYPAP